MADRVDTLDVFSGRDKLIRRISCLSDGTGETNVIKWDKSTFVNWSGLEPARGGLYMIQWSIQGFSSIELMWDHTTDDEAKTLAAGNGMWVVGQTPGLDSGILWDPASAGQTGDLLLTSRGAIANASYDITLGIRYSGASV
jgi:hypothetical protein